MILAYLADELGQYLYTEGIGTIAEALIYGLFIVLAILVGFVLLKRGTDAS